MSGLSSTLRGRCPRCGKGKLFRGFLGIEPACSACGLDYSPFDQGDGPAVFVILIVGFVVVGAALIVEVQLQPPYWVHMALWLPAVLVLTLGLLRPLKAWLVAEQYRTKAAPGEIDRE